jgi:hypothetical protein
MTQHRLSIFLALAALGLAGCSTVAEVAQNVADTARGSSQPSANSKAPQTPGGAPVAQEPCAANFAVTGSFISGKQFKSSAPLTKLSPDNAYKKAHAATITRGWQLISADKEMRTISANQQVNYSSGGKTVPLNILIKPDAARGSVISFTFSTAGGLFASEDAVRDVFCQFTNDLSGQ